MCSLEIHISSPGSLKASLLFPTTSSYDEKGSHTKFLIFKASKNIVTNGVFPMERVDFQTVTWGWEQ